MISSSSARSTRGMATLVGSVLFIIVIIGLMLAHSDSWDSSLRSPRILGHSSLPIPVDNALKSKHAATSKSDEELRNFFLKQIHKPAISPDSATFKPHDAFEWKLPRKPFWQQRMRENLCIIDLDNRDFSAVGQIFGRQPMSWDDPDGVHGLSLGLLNHYVYARIHGYKYYYINTVDPEDRRASWKKPAVISKILKEHDVCIYLDSDAIFHNLNLPFEWLMNYWILSPDNNAMALAVDPDTDGNKDRFGKLNLNTGFIISQNNPTTFKIMEAWNRCPDDDGPYPGCEVFRKNAPGQPTDQGGFGSFVRYNFTDDIRELPCTEANGFPETESGCKGIFIRHLWTGKDNQIKIDVGQQMPGPYLRLFHEQFIREKPTFYIEEKDLFSLGPTKALEGKKAQQ